MKKIICLALAAIMAAALTACGSTDSKNSSSRTSANNTAINTLETTPKETAAPDPELLEKLKKLEPLCGGYTYEEYDTSMYGKVEIGGVVSVRVNEDNSFSVWLPSGLVRVPPEVFDDIISKGSCEFKVSVDNVVLTWSEDRQTLTYKQFCGDVVPASGTAKKLKQNNSSDETEAAESTANAADSGKDKEYEAENKIYPVAESSSEDAPEISTLTLTYNGKTLTYPFTLRDMENIGISFRDYVKDKTVGRRLGMGNIDGETARGEGKMVIAVKNYTGDTASVMDCVVTYISNANIKVAVNSVQPGTTTYEEVLELFGRDKEERKNTLYNENIRTQNEDLDFQLDYSASFDDEYEVGDRYVQLTVLMNFDSEAHLLLDSVREVIYQKN